MSLADNNADNNNARLTGANDNVQAEMLKLGRAARVAAKVLALASPDQKNRALVNMAQNIRARANVILSANAIDLERAREQQMAASFVDRLTLNEERVELMARAIDDIAALDDPVGSVMSQWVQPNGLEISRVRVPIGVIGIIYESRPNVTADAGALCLKSGNAAILRGGSDSLNSSAAIGLCLTDGLKSAGLPEACIQVVPTPDRAAVGAMLSGLDGTVDLIIPRGGKSLVARVEADARVPVFSHLEGLCHVYVDKAADLEMAKAITLNAKLRRTGICGAAETLLIDENARATLLSPLIEALLEAGCEVRGPEQVCNIDDRVVKASDSDWTTEYLDTIISVQLVDGVDAAVDHIENFGSSHTDAIVTDDVEAAEKFLNNVDSAIVLHNASTQYADGGEFGMGAEIGIATGKMHARGPVGVEQLTSFKYVVRGTGQVRP